MRNLVIIPLTIIATGVLALAAPEETERGATLYSQHCASCHGPLASTDKPNRPYGRLASAIRVLPSMYNLRSLSRSDLEAIVLATASPDPDPR